MKKRILSMMLAIVMVVGLIPGFTLTAGAAPLTDSVTNSADGDGVALSKSVTYDSDTGKVTTVIEAYTTGTVTLTDVTKPTDIILVLDVSGSMNYSFDGQSHNSGERLTAMKNAVNSFIDQTATQNASIADPSQMHSIAIVTFADNSTVLAGFTDVNDSSANTLKNTVKYLNANGATAVDYGLKNASDLLTARAAANNGAYAEREKVVIVFTDGEPTHGMNYSAQVAHDAVNNALMIKSTGAKIYTIGIFNGANVNGTNPSNVFMNYTSSNYPKAYGSYNYKNRTYTIYPGEKPYNTGYYMTADNADALKNIFSVISSQIGKPNVELGSSATLVDVVSDYFTIEGLGTENPTITAQTADYKGNGSWAEPVTDNSINPVLTGTDTITINGFDFDKNYISETARDGFYGKKLILKFVTLPDYDKIDEAGYFDNAKIPTNDTTALLDSEGNPVDYVTSPKLTANTVTYRVIDSSTRTIATYYRLPGATVTLLDKPADTAEYTYSEWTTNDATISDNTFKMPEQNVTLTSTGTAKEYTVYYTYKGKVPEGAKPSTAPAEESYAVGADVTLPTVTAPAGYEFYGWTEDGGDVADGVTSFAMPAEDLHFEGYFAALANSYTVEHYMMDTEGNYPEKADHSNFYDGVKTGDTVEATTPDHVGFTFDTDNPNNVLSGTVLAGGNLLLKVYYKRNTHTVTYQYDGTVPEGAKPTKNELKQDPYVGTFYYGQTVTIQPDATADGYTFTGWRVYTGDTTITDGKMIMPDKDVVLYGSFTAKGDTPYTIEHYFENLEDDDYTLNEDLTSHRTGQTDTTAYAEPLSGADIAGFTYDKDNPNNVVSGEISGDPDNPLVLKLYYNRTRHTVTYEYTGAVPTDADPTTAELAATPYYTTEVKYGATVKIADPATADGYEFVGWNITGTGITVDGNTFTMPARDVVLTGHFNPKPSQYTVEHYLEDIDGTTYRLAADPTVHTVNIHVGDTVTGVPNSYNTYTYDPNKTAAENAAMTKDAIPVPTGTVTADGKLVLKLYYTRNAYDITYRFENNPGNLPVPEGHNNVKHGTDVDLADITAPAGYTFDGWYYGETLVGDSLTMPAADVELVGRFTANTDVPYAVKYYLQDVDGDGYTEDTSSSYTRTGTTGEYVVADTKEYPGFSFDTTQGAWNGHIAGDGSLVLELYYNRNTYTVFYYYFGTPPTDTTISMGDTELNLTETNALIVSENVLYGAEKTVESHLTADNDAYEFRGWYTANLPGITSGTEIAAGTPYTMPAHNVEFRGTLYDYTVYYNLNGGTLNGEDEVDPKQVNWDDADLLPDGTPEKDGMIFTGWTYSEKTVSDTDKYSELAGSPTVAFIVLDANYTNGYTITYDWGTENIPAGVTLPTDSKLYAEGDSYTVDTTYTAGYTVETRDELDNVTGVYTFSGWTDPKNGVMGNANVTISGSWTYTTVEVGTWKVEYTWTNAPDGEYAQTIPASVYNITNGASHTVDTTYTSSTVVEEKDEYGNVIGRWTFSGWDKSGTITVTSDVTISGSWTYEAVEVGTWKVEYTWTNAPDGEYAQTIPASVYNITNGASHTVDTTYTSSTVVEEKDEYGNVVGRWTFSGWDKSGTITVTSNITISGSWTYEEVDKPVIPPVEPPVIPPIIPGGTVKLTKVDAEDNSTVLSGVVFKLYRANGIYVGTYTTDRNGEIKVSNLSAGNYYWQETRSAEGYVLDDSKHTFKVTAWQTTSVVIENSKSEVPVVFGDDHYAYIIGYDDGLVHPEANITRAEVATIFFRLLSEETRSQYITRENSFSDVNEGDWYNTAVSTMAAMGIVSGRPGDVFDPNANITRAEFAAIAARFEVHGNTTDASFSDIYEHWAKKEINIAANNGWVLGYEDGTFKPDQYITRAEAMTLVNRVLQRIPESVDDLLPDMVIWPDNMDTQKWYYLMVQEATNSHYYARKLNAYEYWIELREVPDWTIYEK